MGTVVFSDSFSQSYIGYGSYDVAIDFSETYNQSTNKTTIRVTGVAIRKNDNSANYGSMPVYGDIKVGGTTLISMNGSPAYASMDGTSFCSVSIPDSGSVEIQHNADGTGSTTFQVIAGNTENGCTLFGAFLLRAAFGVETASQTVALTTHPRISSVSATNANFGSASTITISRYSSSFKHTVKTSCAGYTETLMTKGSSTSLSWTPAVATYAPRITSAMSATATITCETYNGNSLVGTSTTTCTLTFTAASVAPTLTLSTSDPTGNLSTYGKYVKTKSKIQVTATPSLKYNATLRSTSITANGASFTSSPATTDFITSASNTGVSATIVDSRGQSVSASATIQIYDYTSPKINGFNVSRCNQDGTSNNTGAYMKAYYNVTITALGNQNAKTLKVLYKKTSASSWLQEIVTLSSYSQTGVAIIAADVNSSYNVKLYLQDDFSTQTTERQLGTALTHMNHGSGKNGGVAFGKVSEYDKTLETASDWTVKLGQPLPVTSGGTGATSAAAALTNLGGFSYVKLTNMTDNTQAALLSALNADITAIPLGASAVLCGNSNNANRCVLIAIRLPNNVGRAFCISAYAALNNIFLSLSSGTWSVNS